VVDKWSDQSLAFGSAQAGLNRNTGCFQVLGATASDARVGIFAADDHTGDAGIGQGLGARRRAPVVGTWFEGDEGNSASGSVAGLAKGDDFGMGFSCPGMESLSDDVPFVDQDRADWRVGRCSAHSPPRQSERPLHPAAIIVGPGRRVHRRIISELSSDASVDSESEVAYCGPGCALILIGR